MTVCVRRDTCSLCDQQVFWNDETHILTCGCGQDPARFVNLKEFAKVTDATVPWKGATVRRMFPETFKFVRGRQVLQDSKKEVSL
jgi:hypothetical protein